MLTGRRVRRGGSCAQMALWVAAGAGLALVGGAGRAGTLFSPCGVGPWDALAASDGAEGDWFGWSVAISADTFVAGAPMDAAPEADRGSASVYSYDPLVGWLFVRRLVATGGGVSDHFGWSVSLSGDIIVVGAPQEDDAGTSSGAAYVFDRNVAGGGGSMWGQVKKLLPPDGAAGDQFGVSVVVDGDVAVVGAWKDAAPQSDRGSAHVFVRDAGGANNWGFVKKLVAPDGATGHAFGVSVALEGELALVGASFELENGEARGAAYLFGRNVGGAENWGFIKKFTAPDSSEGDWFGRAVAIGDGAIIIGSPMDDDMGDESGSAYAFMRNAGGAGNWGFASKLTYFDGMAGDQLGTSVAVDSGIALVGSPLRDAGAVRAFMRDAEGNDAWGFDRSIFRVDDEIGDRFGGSVAIGGGWGLVGSSLDDDATHGVDCGTATPFENVEMMLLTSADCDDDDRPDLLQLRLGLIADCNDNGRPDSCDIASGDCADANLNGVPDECEGGSACVGDVNGDGVVGAGDLAALLGAWGACP